MEPEGEEADALALGAEREEAEAAAEREAREADEAEDKDDKDDRDDSEELVMTASVDEREDGAAVSARRSGNVSSHNKHTHTQPPPLTYGPKRGAVHFSSCEGTSRGDDNKEIRRRPVARILSEPLFGRLRSWPPRIVRHDANHTLGVLLVLPRGGDVLGVGVVEVYVDLLLRDERGLHRVPDHERVVALDEGRVGLGVAGKDRVVLIVAVGV